MARAGVGELPDAPLVEQGGDAGVGVPGAVVGVNALNHEGERLDEPFEHRQHEALGDGLGTAHELELGHIAEGMRRAVSADRVAFATKANINAALAALESRLRGDLATKADLTTTARAILLLPRRPSHRSPQPPAAPTSASAAALSCESAAADTPPREAASSPPPRRYAGHRAPQSTPAVALDNPARRDVYPASR